MEVNIRPQIAGELSCRDQFGREVEPRRIYFGCGHGEEPGLAYAIHFSQVYGTSLLPVFRSDGSRLHIEGYAGLTCDYDTKTGTLKNFRE